MVHRDDDVDAAGDDPATWTLERLTYLGQRRVRIDEFAPRAWEAICDLLGGADRMTPRRAAATAPVLLGACIGAADGWGEGEITRHTAEQLLLTVTRALLAADPVVFGEPPRGAN